MIREASQIVVGNPLGYGGYFQGQNWCDSAWNVVCPTPDPLQESWGWVIFTKTRWLRREQTGHTTLAFITSNFSMVYYS